jgi:hypothetical protein
MMVKLLLACYLVSSTAFDGFFVGLTLVASGESIGVRVGASVRIIDGANVDGFVENGEAVDGLGDDGETVVGLLLGFFDGFRRFLCWLDSCCFWRKRRSQSWSKCRHN